MDWLEHVRALSFSDQLNEIKGVSTHSPATQRDRVPALIELLKHKDQSVRIVAAAEIAEIRQVSESALPALLQSFEQPNGEEGMEYVTAVAVFGERALPLLQKSLTNDNWLVRTRACDAIRIIKPTLYKDGECNERAP